MPRIVSPSSARTQERVLPEHARLHNLVLVLRSLFHSGAMSRADLARATGLTRVTTSGLIAELISKGIVVEKGTRTSSGPGKPAVLVDLDRVGLQAVALDLSGADEYRGALMDLRGAVITRSRVRREPGESSSQAQAAVVGLAQDLVQAADSRLLGVGVGSPGVISEDGVVLEAPNIGWQGVPLRQLLQDELGVPVVVGNDANAAAQAEYTLGETEPDLLLIRVGRGVGAGLLIRGMLVTGTHHAAGEIGHVPVGEDAPDAPSCACGNIGCLEAWISVPRLTAALHREGADREAILRGAGARLGTVLAPVVSMLNLSDVVVAASPTLFGDIFLDAAGENLRSHTLGRSHAEVRMRVPAESEEIVLRGALVMVLSSELGIS